MIWLIIISGVCFIIGNVVWVQFDEPKIFYIPLAIFIASMVYAVKKSVPKSDKYKHLFLEYLLLLSYGNVVKQSFYTDSIKQLNDYIWGGIVTIFLISKLLITWATTNNQLSGRK